MSKDLRFEKEGFSSSDWDKSTDISASGEAPNQNQMNAKDRSKQNHLRRIQKRNSALNADIDKVH